MMRKLDSMLAAGDVNFDRKIEGGQYIPQNSQEVFSLVRPSNDKIPWWSLLSGVPLLGFYFWANNQFMVQRVLGAKNLNHGRWGALFAGLLKLPVLFIMVVPGVLGLILFNTLDISALNYVLPDGSVCSDLSDCPNLTYPVLLFQLLPVGVLGLVVAGLMAAMMSSVSATFNSASTLVTMDFVRQLKPEFTSKQLVRVGQITTLVLVILAILWVPLIETVSDSLWEYLQIVIAYTSPPAVATFILGLFWKRANGTGSIVSLLTGFFLAIFMILSQVNDWIAPLNELHFLAKASLLFVISVIIHIVVSLSTGLPDPEKVAEYTYKKELFTSETEELKALPWYKNYRYLSVILLVVTAIIVGSFW